MSEQTAERKVYHDAPGVNLFKPGRSLRTSILRSQWQREGVFGWNNAKVSRICHQMGVTVWELAAMLAIFTDDGDVDNYLVNKFWREDSWPPYIGVMLVQLERDAHDRFASA